MSNENGTITVPGSVLVGIAVRAAEQVDGIKVRRRRTVDVENRSVRLSVAARRGMPLLELAREAQAQVIAAFEASCGIEPTVDVSIGELE